MTNDQKHALYVAGGFVAIGALLYFMQQGSVVVSTPDATMTNPSAPTYMSYNVPPYDASRSPLPNFPPGSLGCGCSGMNDGCFTANIDSGQSPASMDQAVNVFTEQYPDLAQRLRQQLMVYGIN